MRLRDTDLTWQTVDGQLILMDLRDLACLTPNEAGSFLLTRLMTGESEEGLVAALCERFDVGVHRARGDVTAFLGSLREHDLLV